MFDYQFSIKCVNTSKVEIEVAYINTAATTLIIHPNNIAHELTGQGGIMVNGQRCAVIKKYLHTQEVYGYSQSAVISPNEQLTKYISFLLEHTTCLTHKLEAHRTNVTVCIGTHWLEGMPIDEEGYTDVKEQLIGRACESCIFNL